MTRYIMAGAVTILAIAICLVFLAYIAFNNDKNSEETAAPYEHADSLQLIALVSFYLNRLQY